MDNVFQTLILLCVSPILIFVIHMVVQRSRWHEKKIPSQIGAFISLFFAFLGLLFVEWRYISGGISFSSLSEICHLAYFFLVYLMIGFLYVSFLNFSETSLHFHILMEIAQHGDLSLAKLEREYNKDSLTDTKIERLISLGLVICESDRLYSGNKGYLYFAYLIDFWRKVMGMPTEPEGNQNSSIRS